VLPRSEYWCVQLPVFASGGRVKVCIVPSWPVQAMPPLGRISMGGCSAVISTGPSSSERDDTTRSAKYLG
jgi:hypothetical protein